MNPPTCAGCQCFRQFYGERQGECWGALPTMTMSGSQVDRPTIVKLNRPACSQFRPLADGVETFVKGKASPETPGDAIKQARKELATISPQTIIVTEQPLPPAPVAIIQQVEQKGRKGRR